MATRQKRPALPPVLPQVTGAPGFNEVRPRRREGAGSVQARPSALELAARVGRDLAEQQFAGRQEQAAPEPAAESEGPVALTEPVAPSIEPSSQAEPAQLEVREVPVDEAVRAAVEAYRKRNGTSIPVSDDDPQEAAVRAAVSRYRAVQTPVATAGAVAPALKRPSASVSGPEVKPPAGQVKASDELPGLFDRAFHGHGKPREQGGPYQREVEYLYGELFDPKQQAQREKVLRVYGGGYPLVYDPLERREIRPRNAEEHHRDSGASVYAPGLLEARWKARDEYRQQQIAGKVPLAPELSRDPKIRSGQVQQLRTVQGLIQQHDNEVRKRFEAQMLESSSGLGVGSRMSDPATQATLQRMRKVGGQVRAELTPAKFLAWAKQKGITLTPYQRSAVGSLVAWKDISAAHDPEKLKAVLDATQLGIALEGMGPLIETFGRPVVRWLGGLVRKGGEFVEPLLKSGVQKVGELSQGGGGRVLRELAYLGKTAKGYMSTLGPAGKQIGGDLERVSMLADRAAGQSGKVSRQHLIEAAQEVWGDDLERLEPLVEQIARQKSPAEAKRVARFILADVLGQAEYSASAPGSRLFKGLAKYQTVSKLGLRPLSALRNATQRLTNSGLEYGPGPVIKAQAELMMPWRKAGWLMKEAMKDAGVFAGETAGRETTGNRVANWTLALFDKAEAGNRYVAARVKQLGMEQDLNLLMKLQKEHPTVTRLRQLLTLGARSEGAAERRLVRGGLDAEAIKDAIARGGELTPEQVQEAMWRAVQDQQFAQSLASSPMWWQSSPGMRALTQFKVFGAKQANLVWEYVGKELKNGNAAPLARYLLFTQLAGELYHVSQDVMKGGRSSVTTTVAGQVKKGEPVDARQVAKRVLDNFSAGGGIGLLTDFVLAPSGEGQYDRVANFFIGPSGQTVRNVRAAGEKLQANPKEAGKTARELVEKEVPAVRDVRKTVPRVKRALQGKPAGPLREQRELRPLR